MAGTRRHVTMQISDEKLNMILATRLITIADVARMAETTPYTVHKAVTRGAKPITVGRIAAALEVKVEDIIVKED